MKHTRLFLLFTLLLMADYSRAAGTNFISAYPNTTSLLPTDLFIIERPGVSNYNVSGLQMLGEIGGQPTNANLTDFAKWGTNGFFNVASNKAVSGLGTAAFTAATAYDAAGLALNSTNGIGLASSLSAFRPTNTFDAAGAATAATDALAATLVSAANITNANQFIVTDINTNPITTLNGANLTNLTAANVTGTLPLGTTPSQVVTNNDTRNLSFAGANTNTSVAGFIGVGSALTSLTAANLNGQIPMANLSTNVLTATNQPFALGQMPVCVGTNSSGQPVFAPTNIPTGGAGSQTPLTADVNGAGFAITNLGQVKVTGAVTDTNELKGFSLMPTNTANANLLGTLKVFGAVEHDGAVTNASSVWTHGNGTNDGALYVLGGLFSYGVPVLTGASNLDATKLTGLVPMANLSTNVATVTNQPFAVGQTMAYTGTNTSGQPVFSPTNSPMVVSYSTAIIAATNSTTETDMVNFTIPANSLSGNHAYEVNMTGLFLNNFGTPITNRVRIYFGSTVIFDQNLDSTTLAAGSNRKVYRLTATLKAASSLNAQNLDGLFQTSTSGTPTVGIGNLDTAAFFGGYFGNRVALDATTNNVFRVTFTLNPATNSLWFDRDMVSVTAY